MQTIEVVYRDALEELKERDLSDVTAVFTHPPYFTLDVMDRVLEHVASHLPETALVFAIVGDSRYHEQPGSAFRFAHDWNVTDYRIYSTDVPQYHFLLQLGGEKSALAQVPYDLRYRADELIVPGYEYETTPQTLVEMVLSALPKQSTILDPFCGSGTIGLVAKDLGFNYCGIDTNPNAVTIARNRLAGTKKVS